MKTNRIPVAGALGGLFAAALSFLPTTVSAQESSAPEIPDVRVVAIQPDGSEEGPQPALILVVRHNAPEQEIRVQYAIGGTAENEVDYQPLRGVVAIPAGEYFAPIIVTPVDDDLAEPRETVVVELTVPRTTEGAPYRVAWPGRAVVGIADNDAHENRLPVVKLASPPDGSVFRGPLDLPLLALAHDSDGRVESVEFFAGDHSLGVVTNQAPILDPALTLVDLAWVEDLERPEDLPEFMPDAAGFLPDGDLTIAPESAFRLVWRNAPVGSHRLTAVARDDRGGVRTSEAAIVEIVPESTQAVVNIIASDPVAAEGDPENGEINTATFTIHRTGSTDEAMDVFFSFHGTAENGVDFNESPTVAAIPAGERTVTFNIVPIDDSVVEGVESVVVKLEPPICIEIVPPPPGCYLIGRQGRAEARIRDNDDTNENLPPAVQIASPQNGSLHRAGQPVLIVAQAWDRDGRVASVEFFADDESLGVVQSLVPALDAAGNTTSILPPFHLTWTGAVVGTHVLRVEAIDNDGAKTLSKPVEIKVLETAPPPVVNIAAVDAEAAEPTSPPDGSLAPIVLNTAKFRVRRSGPVDAPLTVFYQLSGSAENGVDYGRRPGMIIIQAGHEAAELLIEPLDDSLVEGPESVIVTLLPPAVVDSLSLPPPAEYIVGPDARARAVILDNDQPAENLPPQVAMIRPLPEERFRAGSNVALVADARDRDGRVVSVEFFANGDSLGVVHMAGTVSATGDSNTAADEAAHLFLFTWQNAPAGAFHLTARATDDDGAHRLSEPRFVHVIPAEQQVVTVEAVDPQAGEGGTVTADGAIASDVNTAAFRISRHGDPTVELPVHYALGGSAKNGVDYRELSGEVTIPAGRESVVVHVVPFDDNEVEPLESVVIEILPLICPAIFPPPPTCYLVGQPGRAVAHIQDNDAGRNEPPRVEIATPRSEARFVAPANVEIVAHAHDRDGWVTLVEFFDGEQKIGESVIHYIVPPEPGQRQVFALNWTGVSAGEHVLRVKAVDNLGEKSSSQPVKILVRAENSAPIVNIFPRDPVASEAPLANDALNTATLVVRREGPTDAALDVAYVLDGSAENGVDYQTLSGLATIPAGESSVEIEVVPIDDDVAEHREAVIVKLAAPAVDVVPPPYEIGRHERAGVVILDNDRAPEPGDNDLMPTARRVENGVVMMTLPVPNVPDALIEASENLRDWFPVGAATVVDGVIHFVDAEAAAKRFLFYRVVSSNENVRQADSNF